jgi:hypothetical protein
MIAKVVQIEIVSWPKTELARVWFKTRPDGSGGFVPDGEPPPFVTDERGLRFKFSALRDIKLPSGRYVRVGAYLRDTPLPNNVVELFEQKS